MRKALNRALALGASYVEVRGQEYLYEIVRAVNTSVKEYSLTSRKGLGVRVLLDGRFGFSSTNVLRESEVLKAVEEAVAAAKASQRKVKITSGFKAEGVVNSAFREDPFQVPAEDKVKVVLEANKAGISGSVKSSTTYLGIQKDRRFVITSEGSEAEWSVVMSGLLQSSVAVESGVMERVSNSRSGVAGWEFIEGNDWPAFTEEVSSLASDAVKAPPPPAGKFRVVADPDLIGLILHEAFGHASEGDLVGTGNSVLKGRVGEMVASEYVTIVDDGSVSGGYFVPFDDEGSRKVRTVVVEKGVLKGFLTSKSWAAELGMEVTGNGRAQDFSSPPIVRQTNFFLEGGDWGLEEILEEASEGIYLSGKGAMGGEVDPSAGTFTFSVGPSRLIKGGELQGLVRGTVVSGYILEALKGVEAVGKDVQVKTSVFGGCGKDGQMVRVGHGGPHVLIKELTVGGR